MPIYDPLISNVIIDFIYYDKKIFKSKSIDELYFGDIYTYQIEVPEKIEFELSSELKNELKKYIKNYLSNHKWTKLSIEKRLDYANKCINDKLDWIRMLSNNKDLKLYMENYYKDRKNNAPFKFDFDFSKAYICNNKLMIPKIKMEEAPIDENIDEDNL